MNNYKTRVYDAILAAKLSAHGAVLIRGAKWCGKTTTAKQIAKSVVYMDEPKSRDSNILMAKVDPYVLLSGEAPRLVDEWQLAPTLWDAVRFIVDQKGEAGQFILTGSSVPPDMKEVRHSGAGRIARMTMRTMSLWESDESSGEVSLGDLFNGVFRTCKVKTAELGEIAYLICRGGWPQALDMTKRDALRQPFEYLNAIVETDIMRVDGVERRPVTARKLLKSLARLQGASAAATVMAADIGEGGKPVHANTVHSYLNALAQMYVTEDMEPWFPSLRSKARLRTLDTRYFTDPSIAVAALQITPADLMDDLRTFGLLFETMAMRDLRSYADALSGNVYHYHDSNGLECDAIIHLDCGKYGLVEVKLGGEALIESGAKTLASLSKLIDTGRMKPPSFKLVLTAVGEYAYRRPEDGIIVCPICCLKP